MIEYVVIVLLWIVAFFCGGYVRGWADQKDKTIGTVTLQGKPDANGDIWLLPPQIGVSGKMSHSHINPDGVRVITDLELESVSIKLDKNLLTNERSETND